MDFSNVCLFDSPFKHVVFIFTPFGFEIHDFAHFLPFFFLMRESGQDKIPYQQSSLFFLDFFFFAK